MAKAALPLTLALALAACATADKVVTPPVAGPLLTYPVPYYVGIPAEKTARCPWKRDVKPSEGLAAARERARCLERYEAQLGEIEAVEGEPVPVK